MRYRNFVFRSYLSYFIIICKINKSYLYILSFHSGNFAFGKIEEQIIQKIQLVFKHLLY